MWVLAMIPYLAAGLWITWSSLRVQRARPVTILLKFIHLAAIALWSGGLIVLPFLFWQRRTLAAVPSSTGCIASRGWFMWS